VQSTWTIVGAPGDPIPAGTYLTINDQGFYVQAETPVATGNSTITGVTLVAVDSGTSYNNLAGPPILSEQIDWVTTVAQTGLTSEGADPEGDDSYQNRLAADLRLQAPRPITASDYPPFVLSVPSTIVPAGVVVGRATAIDGYNPTATATFTANTTNGSASLTSASSIAALGPGTKLSGTGIPANTTVLSAASTTVVMDKQATATGSVVTITATGTYNNSKVISTFVTDPSRSCPVESGDDRDLHVAGRLPRGQLSHPCPGADLHHDLHHLHLQGAPRVRHDDFDREHQRGPDPVSESAALGEPELGDRRKQRMAQRPSGVQHRSLQQDPRDHRRCHGRRLRPVRILRVGDWHERITLGHHGHHYVRPGAASADNLTTPTVIGSAI
jgi:hypothetical protein